MDSITVDTFFFLRRTASSEGVGIFSRAKNHYSSADVPRAIVSITRGLSILIWILKRIFAGRGESEVKEKWPEDFPPTVFPIHYTVNGNFAPRSSYKYGGNAVREITSAATATNINRNAETCRNDIIIIIVSLTLKIS